MLLTSSGSKISSVIGPVTSFSISIESISSPSSLDLPSFFSKGSTSFFAVFSTIDSIFSNMSAFSSVKSFSVILAIIFKDSSFVTLLLSIFLATDITNLANFFIVFSKSLISRVLNPFSFKVL